MTGIGTPMGVERQQFFNGQRLFADDLQQIERFHREMRELHNRSLHQPGVGSGFAVSGNVGDREVRIGAGYAIDDQGREIILTSERAEPIPPVAGVGNDQPIWFDLVVAYPPDDALEATETRLGVCRPAGVLRLREEPVFCWAELQTDEAGDRIVVNGTLRDQIERGERIRLARIAVLDCQLKSLSITERRDARPKTQPYVFGGRQPCVFCLQGEGEFVCAIDTTAASFVTTPSYFVSWELDDAALSAAAGSIAAVSAKIAAIGFLLPVDVRNPEPNSFELAITFDRQALRKVGIQLQVNAEGENCFSLPLTIAWIGVE